MLRPRRGGAGRLRVLRPVNTEYVIVFQGWRATSGRVRRAISLRNAPTGNPVHPPNHGGNVTGTCGRGRRPRRPAPGAGRPAVRPDAWGRAGARDARPYQRRGPHAPGPTCVGGGVGTAATSAALPHGTARFHFGTHVFPHPATRCCKMRFHRVIISPRNNLENLSRRAAGSTRAAFPGAASAARARREADAFPVLAHRVPVVICITFPCEARAAGDTALPLENREKKVNVPFLCRPGRKLRRTHYSRQRA